MRQLQDLATYDQTTGLATFTVSVAVRDVATPLGSRSLVSPITAQQWITASLSVVPFSEFVALPQIGSPTLAAWAWEDVDEDEPLVA